MATLVHGYNVCEVLPAYSGLAHENLNAQDSSPVENKGKSTIAPSSALLVTGHSIEKYNLSISHSGSLIVICGNNVTLRDVTFEGKGERNLVVICNNATLSNVTIRLDGMGLVVIGAGATICDSALNANENVGPDCMLFKSLITFPGEPILGCTINRIRIRKWPSLKLSAKNGINGESSPQSTAEIFSRALSNQFSEKLRTMEDTKEFRRELMAKDELFHQMRLLHNRYFATVNTLHDSTSQPRIACIMMQRNEKTLLKPWVEYYSDLFGASNLFIFDNGSTNEKVKTYLEKIRQERGIHVDCSHQSSVDFRRKGVIFHKLIKELEALDYYDLFLPLDCDEFISVMVKDRDKQFSLDKKRIYEELKQYVFSPDALKVKTFFNNIPHKVDTFYEQKGEKTFFSANTIASLDHGFHNGKTISDKELKTNIAYVHFHNKSLSELKEHAYNKLAPMFDIDNSSVSVR